MDVRFEPKKDCFGWDKTRNGCEILEETLCKKGKCGFYKKKGTLCNGCIDQHTGACVRCKEARKWNK